MYSRVTGVKSGLAVLSNDPRVPDCDCEDPPICNDCKKIPVYMLILGGDWYSSLYVRGKEPTSGTDWWLIECSSRLPSAKWRYIVIRGTSMEMKFDARVLPATAEYKRSNELLDGETYFIVDYTDPDLLVPVLRPVVFVGRDVERSGSGHVYFQDMDSYRDGVRVNDPVDGELQLGCYP
jgi:hypothetical protein